jgi:6-phosphogluconate dehydrogenase
MAAIDSPALAAVFDSWNQGALESFLIEITSTILRVRDPETGGWLVDFVLDQAGQKGTGRWTAQVALELGVAVPSIAAAIDARVLSSMKASACAPAASCTDPPGKPQSRTASGSPRTCTTRSCPQDLRLRAGAELIATASRPRLEDRPA